MFKRSLVVIAFIGLLLLMMQAITQQTLAQNDPIKRVSVASNGMQSNDSSQIIQNTGNGLSANGRFTTYMSGASNLVSGDTNNSWDVFVHDQVTGETIRASVSSSGEQGNFESIFTSITSNGRRVVFASGASNLIANGTHGGKIYMHDLDTGETTLVSIYDDGSGYGDHPAISGNGRYVGWEGTNVYLRDLQTSTSQIISVSPSGLQGNDRSESLSFSHDGRYVAFASFATNLVDNDTNGYGDVFVRDLQTGVTRRISVSASGEQGNATSSIPFIAASGCCITFTSSASNLVANDTNNKADVFLYNLLTDTLERVSLTSAGAELNDFAAYSGVSEDGRFITFNSPATNLLTIDQNGAINWDVYLRDQLTHETILLSKNAAGEQGNQRSDSPYISDDGHYVMFESTASNLVNGDTNGKFDIFVAENPNWEEAEPTQTPSPTFTPVPTDSPVNIAPARNYFSALPVVLTWNWVSWAVSYQVQVDDNSNFSSPTIITAENGDLSVTIPTLANGTFYWRVRAMNAAGIPGAWSAIERFLVDVP